jgi:SAM-dependent methyltransferase
MAFLKRVVANIPGAQGLRSAFRRARQQRCFRGEFEQFRKMAESCNPRFTLHWSERWPCLNDRTGVTSFDRHYVYHTAWAARMLAALRPARHVDISSSLYFCSIVSAFLPVDFYDYRPADLRLSGLTSQSADLLNLPFADGSLTSLSCMHVIEHIGLGRYGDPFDPEGDLKAMAELKRVLAVGGYLLFVVPVGRPRIQFNAHRIYSYRQVIHEFQELELIEFTLIPEFAAGGGPIAGATEAQADAETYGCGCFLFRKAT